MLKKLILNYKKFNEIEFMGQISNKDTKLIISNAKAVVTATKLFEGQPTLLCEASSLGIPSVFPRFGGIEEFFPEDVKLSFEQFNYEDLKLKMKLIDSSDFINEGKSNKNYFNENFDKIKFIQKFKDAVYD